jgi:hypothetical protein
LNKNPGAPTPELSPRNGTELTEYETDFCVLCALLRLTIEFDAWNRDWRS